MVDKITTGVDVLRQTVKARNKTPAALIRIAREIDGVDHTTLEAFSMGKTDLGAEALRSLAKVLYDAEFDQDTGMLISSNKTPPIPMCSAFPPPPDPKTLPTFKAGPPPPQTGYGAPPKPQKHAGWLGGFF